jgi:ABC-type multidrug transport system permease subunit
VVAEVDGGRSAQVPLRILPSVVCAAIVYPAAGLAGASLTLDVGTGWQKALMFVASLSLTNMLNVAVLNCIGIFVQGAGLAVLIGVLYSLFCLTCSGFIVNANKLPEAMRWVLYLSPLRYFFEATMSNELLGECVENGDLLKISARLTLDGGHFFA